MASVREAIYVRQHSLTSFPLTMFKYILCYFWVPLLEFLCQRLDDRVGYHVTISTAHREFFITSILYFAWEDQSEKLCAIVHKVVISSIINCTV